MLWMLVRLGVVLSAIVQEEPRPVFRVGVDAVQVDVFAGKGGKAVLGLNRDDFEVYDNGVLQQVEVLRKETEPLSAFLVFDTSWSVQGEKLGHLKEASRIFVDGMEPKDRAALLCFSSNLQLSSGLSVSSALEDALDDIRALGSTSLYDGLYAGLKMAESSRRPLILLFTDGVDTFSWLTDVEVSRVVEESNAVIYVVSTAPKDTRVTWGTDLDTEFLRNAAAVSGGRYLHEETSSRLRSIFRDILNEMKTRYWISYIPMGVDEDGWHELDIRVKRRGVDVIARRGYWRRERQ